MTTKCRCLFTLFVACAGLLALVPASSEAQKDKKPAAGQEPAAKKNADDPKAQYISDLMTAYRLTEIGRTKGRPAPEALLTAAGMLRRLAKVPLGTIDEKSEVDLPDGQKLTDADIEAKVPNLEEQANDLIEEARAQAAELKLNLEPLIKSIQERPLSRAVVGGPRAIARHIHPHQTHTFHFHFISQMPAAIGFRASHPMRIRVVRTDYNHVWEDTFTMHGVHHGVPGGSPGQRAPVRISIHNPSNHRGMFQLFVN
jgi:hypothetical protein